MILEFGRAMHGAAVIPHHQIADLPYLIPLECFLRGMRPQAIQQIFAFIERHADDVSGLAAAQKQAVLMGLRVRADDRVYRARRFARVNRVLEADA